MPVFTNVLDNNKDTPTATVAVLTLDRPEAVNLLLCSLHRQIDNRFSIFVVVGPGDEKTPVMLKEQWPNVAWVRCGVRNVSAARNTALRSTTSDYIVFIDDDAVVFPMWFADLMEPFINDHIAAVGGDVYDHTGMELEFRYLAVDRLGNVTKRTDESYERQSFPQSLRFPYVPGGNAAYRRQALVEIGGFDEFYEYYLDEADACLRLTDAGYLMHQRTGAAMLHKSLPSSVRSTTRAVKTFRPLIKNRAYFAHRYARDRATQHELDECLTAWKNYWLGYANDMERAGVLEKGTGLAAVEEIRLAHLEGVENANRPSHGLLSFDGVELASASPRCGLGGTTEILIGHSPESISAAHHIAMSLIDVHLVLHDDVGFQTMDFDGLIWIHRIPRNRKDFEIAECDRINTLFKNPLRAYCSRSNRNELGNSVTYKLAPSDESLTK